MTQQRLIPLIAALALVFATLQTPALASSPADWGVTKDEWLTLPGPALRTKIGAQARKAELEALSAKDDTYAQVILASGIFAKQWPNEDLARAVALAQKAEEKGDARAAQILAVAWQAGLGVAKDEVKARALMLKAADGGMVPAMYQLSNLLRSGTGGTVDADASAHWMQRAATAGLPDAMNDYGASFSAMTPPKHGEAALWIERAAAAGSAQAMLNLSRILDTGTGLNTDPKKALYWLEQAAEKGNVEALHSLAAKLEVGKDLPKDLQRAATLYTRAAEAGHIPSAARIGTLKGSDMLGPPDYAAVEKWLKIAADAGDGGAAYLLAITYLSDDSGRKNTATGRQYMQISADKGDQRALAFFTDEKRRSDPLFPLRSKAESGDSSAMVSLAVKLVDGTPSRDQLTEALGLMRKAVDLGNIDAMRNLALMTVDERYGLNDPKAALSLMAKAAEGGNVRAMLNLGLWYADGKNTDKDIVLGEQWLRKAAAAGNSDGKHSLGRLLRTVKPDEANQWLIAAGAAFGEKEPEMAAKAYRDSLVFQIGRKDVASSLSSLRLANQFARLAGKPLWAAENIEDFSRLLKMFKLHEFPGTIIKATEWIALQKEAVADYRKAGDRDRLINSLFLLTEASWIIDEKTSAAAYAEIEQLARAANDQRTLDAVAINRFHDQVLDMDLRKELGDQPAKAGYEALVARERIGEKKGIAATASTLAYFIERDELKQQDLYRRAIAAIELTDDKAELMRIKMKYAQLLIDMKEYGLATGQAYFALNTARILNDPYYIANGQQLMGEAKFRLNEGREAEDYLSKAQAGYAAIGQGDIQYIMYLRAFVYYNLFQNPTTACTLMRSAAQGDSIGAKFAKPRVADFCK